MTVDYVAENMAVIYEIENAWLSASLARRLIEWLLHILHCYKPTNMNDIVQAISDQAGS